MEEYKGTSWFIISSSKSFIILIEAKISSFRALVANFGTFAIVNCFLP